MAIKLPYKIDLVGKRFGETTVIAFAGRDPKSVHNMTWRCRCDCGVEHVARSGNLKSGNTQSCGHRHSGGRATERHGHHNSATYSSWEHAVDRCTNPKNQKYHLYGGRGIAICDEWRNSFAVFLLHMGERPRGKTLDRIDPDKGYEPGNCRWATVLEQNRNLKTARRVEFRGEIVALSALSERFGIPHSTVRNRVLRGVPLEKALGIAP